MTTAITVNQFYWRLIEFLFMTRFLYDRQEVFFWHISEITHENHRMSLPLFVLTILFIFGIWVCLLFVTMGDRQIIGRQRGLVHDFSEVSVKNMQMMPSWHWEVTYVSLRFRVQSWRTKWNFPLNFRTVAYPGLLLKGPSFRVTEWSFLNYLIMQLASTLCYHV